MNDIVGIDLGTTNSLIGVMEAGFPLLIADENGARLTPSIVHFPETAEPLVGAAAKRMLTIAPARTVTSIKRLMGTAERLRFGDREFSPEQISAFILKKLKGDAERALERSVARAVITVPAYFNDAQRNATKRAGELAGFTVERIVNEPTAAALAYGLDKLSLRAKVAVYDLGGGTFDISVLELNNGVFEVIATNGNTRLGGDDIDHALMQSIQKKIGRDLAPEDLARLREQVVEAKHRLSTDSSATIDLPFIGSSKN